MNFEELLTLAFRAIIGNKLRSFLTTLGITIGVFAIIVFSLYWFRFTKLYY